VENAQVTLRGVASKSRAWFPPRLPGTGVDTLEVGRRTQLPLEQLLWKPALAERSLIMNMQEFLKNRQQFPAEELQKYIGKYVAWSPDGTRIVAGDDDELRLDASIRAAGYDPSEVLVSFVPDPDEVILGGGGVVE
jgi:hypothetical protein